MAYRNMVLVSLEEYQNLRKQLYYQQAPELTRDLYKVKEQTAHLPLDQRVQLEGEVLREHIQQLEATPAPPSPPLPVFDDSVVLRNLKGFSKLNNARAKHIYEHLKAYKTQWNEMGQLLDSNGRPIPHSNIIELIDYITNTKAQTRIPAGFDEFLSLLQESQLPRNFLSTKGLTRVQDYKQLETEQEVEEKTDNTQGRMQDYKHLDTEQEVKRKWKPLKRLRPK